MEFPSTQWAKLAEATLHGDASSKQALSVFCQSYRRPLVAYALSRGLSREDSEDAAQSFLLHIMERSVLRRADPERGRFRNFLLGAFRNFLADRRDRANAQRRGGGIPNQSIDLEENLAIEAVGSDQIFDREWALAVLQRAIAKVESDRPPGVFATIRPFLPGAGPTPSFAEASLTSGMSETALRSEVSRVRARLREYIRSEVAATVETPTEIDAEMAWLLRVLSGSQYE